MHSGGSRRVVMNLLQNYMLRNSIDRYLIGGNSVLSGISRSSRSLSTTMSRTSSSSEPGSTKNGNNTSFVAGLPPEPPLDNESKSKLNQLKEGLQSKNEYFEKYKEKLTKLESHSPRELLARLEQLDDQKKDLKKRMKMADKVANKPRTLNDVMHIDSLKNLERSDIVNLWQEFHRRGEGLLGAVMSKAIYEKMRNLASVHKMFVMPLPRPDGYEFFFMQFEDNTFHFTPLIAYQTHQESAPVSLRLINYTDLSDAKDLILLRGEYDSKSLKAEDAHFLAVQTNFYYGETNDSRLALLEKFTDTPDLFKHMELIDELKKIQSTHAQLFEFEATNTSNAG